MSLYADADWQYLGTLLATRSGARCEIRSPACIAGPRGDLNVLPPMHRSFHHRRPRGKGGTSRANVHSLAALINTCGHGTLGCHWYVEQHRDYGRVRGLLVPNVGTAEATDPARVPVVLSSGRRVLLSEDGPFYLPPPDGIPYALDVL